MIMTAPDIQHLIEKSSETDLASLLKAKETAKKLMMDEPTPANISAYDRAAALLDKAIERDREKSSAVKKADEAAAPRFRKLSEVVKYLQDEGYKIKKSKVYKDAASGFLMEAAYGNGYSLNDVIAYAATQSLDKVSDSKTGKVDHLTEMRLTAEVEKLRIQVEKMTWEMNRDQGKYLLKEDVRTELALKISVFEAGFKHAVAVNAADWIAAVGGKAEKIQVMVEMMNMALDNLFSEFAEVDELDLVVQSYQ